MISTVAISSYDRSTPVLDQVDAHCSLETQPFRDAWVRDCFRGEQRCATVRRIDLIKHLCSHQKLQVTWYFVIRYSQICPL